jgi:hypothetical protein
MAAPRTRPSLVVLCLASVALVACDGTAGKNEPISERSSPLVAPLSGAPEQAAANRLSANEARRKRIDDAKGQVLGLPDSPARQAKLDQIKADVDEEVKATEGISTPVSTRRDPQPAGATATQRQALLTKMAGFDLKDPAQQAAWAQIKRKELGR